MAEELITIEREKLQALFDLAVHSMDLPEPKIPMHRLDIDALTDAIDDPTEAVQYCVVDGGIRHVYGDQQWVADGRALYPHPDGHVEQRTITITYGEWGSSGVAVKP